MNGYGREVYGKTKSVSGGGNTDRYPRSVITFSSDTQKSKLHPTQKPLHLLKYLVRTYTNEGDLVIDSTAGSGTTGIACDELNRGYILIEKEEKYINIIKERLKASQRENKINDLLDD